MQLEFKQTKRLLLIHLYLLGAVLLVSCSPNTPINSTVLPSQSPKNTETVAPTQSPTDLPATNTPELILPTESIPLSTEVINLYDQSVLSDEQKEILYQTSLTFIADTEKAGFEIGMYLDYSNYGYPGLVCGPLASGILRDAGLLNKYTIIKDFWLLDPSDDYTVSLILENNFPRDKYLWFKTETALDKFDFVEFPLYTGDFLYFYAGELGTYEHMLTVSKVDQDGRVYAVSNYLAENGEYLIHEFMLYDPNDPGQGYFYVMADRSKSGGTTGFGGFQLWRPSVPIPPSSLEDLVFSENLDELIDPYVDNWKILIKEIGGERIYDRLSHKPTFTTSSVKLPIAALILKALELKGTEDIPDYLALTSPIENDRTFEQLLKSMLYGHDTGSIQLLINWLYGNSNVNTILYEWGLGNTFIDKDRTTLNDLSILVEGLYDGTLLSTISSDYLLKLLEANPPGENKNIAVIRDSLSDDDKIKYLQEKYYLEFEEIFELVLVQIEDSNFLIILNGYNFNDLIYSADQKESNFLEESGKLIIDYLQDRNN